MNDLSFVVYKGNSICVQKSVMLGLSLNPGQPINWDTAGLIFRKHLANIQVEIAIKHAQDGEDKA